VLLNIIGEEAELEDNEDDEQLDQYDSPQRAPQRHTAETVKIQMPYVS
jgi:hypothetical protein